MARTELPQGPWQDLGMDFMGPLPNGDNILVLVDYFSRYFEVEFMKCITVEVVTRPPLESYLN